MAVIRLAQPFDAFHGTVAGLSGDSKLTVFSTPKSSGLSRQWVVPANPQSTNQMLLRSYQIAAAAAYSDLTQAQAALWIAAAEQIHRENIIHLTYELSGINLFCMINSYRQIDGQAIVDDLPPIEKPAVATDVHTVSKSNPTLLAFIAVLPGAKVNEMAMCRVSPVLPSPNRKARKNDVRLIGSLPQNIVTHSSGEATFLLTVPQGMYVEADPIGIEITTLSASYYPGDKFLVPNTPILW